MASYLSGTGSSKKIMDKELYKKLLIDCIKIKDELNNVF